jgi:mannose-6-phosphate isomerase-like protein (cupin superfamily)
VTARPAPAPFAIGGLPWHEPQGHHDSFSQYVVGLEDFGAGVDVRMSRCSPAGRVDSHVHEAAEHVYYFLSGTGLVTSDDVAYPVERDMVLYVPPQTEHSIQGSGEEDLVFLVVTAPSGALPR